MSEKDGVGPASLSKEEDYNRNFEKEVEEEEDEDENDEYMRKISFQSIRSNDGLEVAISVQWDGMKAPLHIDTLLEEDDLAPLFAGAQWAGTRVWHAAIAMTDFLVKHHSQALCAKENGDRTITTTRVLELGCGLGVPGMILHSLYRNIDTFLTDQESILSQLTHNLGKNFPQDNNNNNNDESSNKIEAMALDWSREAARELVDRIGPLDVVLNCDCVYEPLYGDSWKLLADVLDELLRANPHALVLTSVERRNADAVDQFLERLESSPHISQVQQVFVDKPFRIEIYQAHGKRQDDEN